MLTKFQTGSDFSFDGYKTGITPVSEVIVAQVMMVHTMVYKPTQIKRFLNGIAIQWSDGHRSEHSHKLLRQKCPCARCKAVRENENPLRVLPSEDLFENLKVVNIQPVGRYAIRLTWNDGHKTGIYPFELLRSLNTNPANSPP